MYPPDPSKSGEPSSAAEAPPPAPAPEPVTGIPVGMFYPAPPMERVVSCRMAPAAGGAWTTALCDCADDCNTCCMACWCPCIPVGQIAEIVDRGSSSCALNAVLYCLVLHVSAGMCQWVYSCAYRARLRAAYDLPETPCSDCLVTFCCQTCSIAQMHRELKNRGHDPNLGWEVNSRRTMMTPPQHQAMEGMTTTPS
ncbi:cell number regulator 10-like [Oryza glaberrima]|uniref:Cadmium resistance protein n=2 Tax=Oryza TaxID=4527 RepID=A0A0D3HAJ4_9ORYZ|nr:cell number regulator 10-like [Oryza glaberrima]XP_052134719.1 cell number regulator 10-like [Oryza glaberrima]